MFTLLGSSRTLNEKFKRNQALNIYAMILNPQRLNPLLNRSTNEPRNKRTYTVLQHKQDVLKPKRVAQKAFIHVGLCVSSRNKCVIGLRDHSWKDPWSGAETGPEGNYNQSAPATHTGREDGENEETGWRQLWVPVLRRTVFISIIRKGGC